MREDDFPRGLRVYRGSVSIKYLPDGSVPPWQGDHWVIGFHASNMDLGEIRGWIEEIEEAGEPPTELSFDFGYAAVIVQRRSSVTEAILKYS